MKQATIFLILVVGLTGFSCQKNADELVAAHDIAIWSLKNYRLAGDECQLHRATLEKKEELLTNEDIQSYHATGHYFTLTAAGINKLKGIKSKTPFCLQVNQQVLYTGFLMPGYLSLYCTGVIVIDPIPYSNNTIRVGYNYAEYAGASQLVNDLRNDPVLLKALDEQGKLRK